MSKQPLSKTEQFAYVFIICQYIETLKEVGQFNQREKAKILKLLDDLKAKGIYIDNLEPVYLQLSLIPDEPPQ